ncbi:unnamed protein product [Hyaloperonospora brassicae]|uniref:UDENN domain-containing protein n=1 Tax=Hyaloperonospora brassicae TaxID=162125 RepID=A0AAV0TUR8_HYABA|nr:unnamed protein product [Hyaloperonospora brassicae]
MTSSDTSARPLAETVLYAEFDLIKGSTLRGSYPRSFTHYSPEFFADIMLPEGVHNRHEDFTIFFLNRHTSPKGLLGVDHCVPDGATATSDAATFSSDISPTDSTRVEEDGRDPLKRFMYCLSVVRTTHDTAARRGAKVTAVALCSTYRTCVALKDVLNMAVLKMVATTSETESEQVLRELFDVVNAVDISGLSSMSSLERRLSRCRSIGRSGRAQDDPNEATTLAKARLFQTEACWDDISMSLQFQIGNTDDQHDDGTLMLLLQTFGDQTMVLFNAVLTGQRVVMLGYNRPAGEVCNFVLATSSLVCPPLFGLVDRQYPYANLTDLGFLSTPGYIAGVTNPMFKTKREWWDVLCDISTGEVFAAAPVEKEEYDALDRNFVLEVLDGVAAGYDEEWVRSMYEEYVCKNVVDIAVGEANYLSRDALAKCSAMNNKRITNKWRPAQKTGVDLKRHIRSLQGDMMELDDTLVEKIYSDFVALLETELELQEFLSFLPVLRGGLQTVAQGIFHPSISVKYNTVVLLKRLEQFPSTASSVHKLNPFLLMSYQRIHDVVKPDVKE